MISIYKVSSFTFGVTDVRGLTSGEFITSDSAPCELRITARDLTPCSNFDVGRSAPVALTLTRYCNGLPCGGVIITSAKGVISSLSLEYSLDGFISYRLVLLCRRPLLTDVPESVSNKANKPKRVKTPKSRKKTKQTTTR